MYMDDFKSKWGAFRVLFYDNANVFFFKYDIFILNVPNGKSIALSVPTLPKTAYWNIGPSVSKVDVPQLSLAS